MLKKEGFGLLALVLVSFAIDPFPQTFARPWNYEVQWPGNSDVVDYTLVPPLSPEWDIYQTQASLDRLAVNSVEGEYRDAPTVREAQGNYSLARNIWTQVDDFTNYWILPYIYNVKDICAASGDVNCACFVVDRAINCNLNFGRDFRYFIAKRWFSEDYAKAWRGTMNNALDALEARVKRLNGALVGLEAALIEAEYAGVCGQDVAGHEACAEAEALLAAAGKGGSGDFALVRSMLENNTLRVYDDVPLIEFGWPMNIIGDDYFGAVNKVNAAAAQVDAQVSGSAANYESVRAEAVAEIAAAELMEQAADDAELWRVGGSAVFGENIGDGLAAVDELAESGKRHVAEAKRRLEYAETAAAHRGSGYLKNALANATAARELAKQAEDEFSAALDVVETVVQEYEGEARARISDVERKFASSAWPSRAKALYDDAEAEFQAGLDEEIQGRRLEYYARAIADAEAALAVSSEAEADTNWSAIGTCAEAEALLARAETDGIQVEFERAYLSVLENGDNASALLAGCSAIIASVGESAMERYSDLPRLRGEVIAAIEECGEGCTDLALMVEQAEAGLVSAGTISYPEAVGSLAELRKKYGEILKDAHESMVNLGAGRLLASASLYSEDAVLDGESESSLEIIVVNAAPYAGKNLVVEAGSKVEFSQDDVVIGADLLRGVAYYDGKIRLYLKAIGGYERQRYLFEKREVVMKTEKVSVDAIGFQNYSAMITESRDVRTIGDVWRFAVAETWDGLYIDGVPAAIGEGGMVSRKLEEGLHTFEAQYTMQDAYERKFAKNLSTKIGERTYQRYQIELVPNVDMVYLETFAEVPPQDEVREKQVITVTGEKVEAMETADGYVVRVYGLKKGKAARFEVSYYVDNTSAYVNATIKELNASNISASARALVDEASDALAAMDEVRAVEKLQQAYEQIRKDEVELEKLEAERDRLRSEVAAEINKIGAALGEAVVRSGLYDRISARKDYLERLISSLEGMNASAQVSALSGYDNGWLADQMKEYRKNASGKLNRLYARYLDNGEADAQVSVMFGKARAEYDKFEASGELVDAFGLDAALDGLEANVEVLENASAAKRAEIAEGAQALVEEAEAVLDDYSKAASDAKGSRFESVFKVDSADVKAAVSSMKKAIGKEDMDEIGRQYASISDYIGGMESTLDYLEGAAGRNAQEAMAAYEAYGQKIQEKERKKAAALAAELDSYLEAGEYVKALEASDEIIKVLSAAEDRQDYSGVLLASAVFVAAAAAIYYFKERFGKGGYGEKRKFRPLEKAV